MNRLINRCLLISLLVFMGMIVSMVFFNSDVFAAEPEGSQGSSVQDIMVAIMLWVNFAILVSLFLKFGRKPLMIFLHGEQKKISDNIDTVEDQLKKARSLMEVEAEKLENMDARLNEIKDNILSLGRREKEKIIDEAKRNSVKMIDDAEKEAQFSIIAARDKFREEMLWKAISITVERLTKGMSSEDNDIVVDQFASNLSKYQHNI
ncbi:ATP synthase F0 subunit B [Thermodesulfobacteriota bacterium]